MSVSRALVLSWRRLRAGVPGRWSKARDDGKVPSFCGGSTHRRGGQGWRVGGVRRCLGEAGGGPLCHSEGGSLRLGQKDVGHRVCDGGYGLRMGTPLLAWPQITPRTANSAPNRKKNEHVHGHFVKSLIFQDWCACNINPTLFSCSTRAGMVTETWEAGALLTCGKYAHTSQGVFLKRSQKFVRTCRANAHACQNKKYSLMLMMHPSGHVAFWHQD